MKHTNLILAASLLAFGGIALSSCQQQEQQPKQPKYVFYLINDGTGVNVVLGAEMYQAELEGRWGRVPSCMASFPVVGMASTYSYSSGITDSAASGTALATGHKTYNGALGVNPDTVPVRSIAECAHEMGFPVGVATSVNVNHATPGAFYGHESDRNHYYEIACTLPTTGFDFFGGSDINLQRGKNTPEIREELYKVFADSGYVISRGTYADYETKANEGAQKMILFQDMEVVNNGGAYAFPYNIDAPEGQLSVLDVMKAETDFLYRRSEAMGGKGFFLMNEVGGKIDMACHANDGATTFSEFFLADECVRVAYEFYLQHPDETLIVVTSDHETGGLTIGNNAGGYATNLQLLQHQKCSVDEITRHLQTLRSETRNRVKWEQVKEVLSNDLGFWQGVEISKDEEAMLKDLYKKSFVGKMANEENLYSANEPMAAAAVRLLNTRAHLGWTSGAHTAGLVSVFAIGVGAETFAGHNDNADLPRKIAEVAGYTTFTTAE